MQRRAAILAAPALLVGCANPLTQPFPEKKFFVLEARRPNRLPPRSGGKVLLLRTIAPAPGAELRGIVTRVAGGQTRADFWNEFFAPPASLVQDQLRMWLSDSGLFAAVVDQGSRSTPSLALEAALNGLFADASEAPATARIQMQTLLLGVDRTPARVLLEEQFDRRAQISALDPTTIIAGFNVVLSAIFSSIESSLSGFT